MWKRKALVNHLINGSGLDKKGSCGCGFHLNLLKAVHKCDRKHNSVTLSVCVTLMYLLLQILIKLCFNCQEFLGLDFDLCLVAPGGT